MKKVPVQIHIDPPLLVRLRAEAAKREISLGEVVRLALHSLFDAPKD